MPFNFSSPENLSHHRTRKNRVSPCQTLVKFILSFQNFGEKMRMRSATQPYCNMVEYGCVSLRMRFFGTIKRILPGSSSPSLREGPGIEVAP